MYEQFVRAMNEEERRSLQSRIARLLQGTARKNHVKWVLVWSFGVVICVLVPLAALISGASLAVFVVLGSIMSFAGIVCLYALIAVVGAGIRSRRYRSHGLNVLARLRSALTSNQVMVKHIEAFSVVVIEPFEDEGPGYVFDIGEGRILFLLGEEYQPISDDVAWPNGHFEIVRSFDGSIFIGVFCRGLVLQPSRVVDGAAYREEVLSSKHEDIVVATVPDFLDRILRWQGHGRESGTGLIDEASQ